MRPVITVTKLPKRLTKSLFNSWLGTKGRRHLLGSCLMLLPEAALRRNAYVQRTRAKKLITPKERECGIIFIHVPKTGGVSVSEALLGDRVGHRTMVSLYLHDPAFARTAYSFGIVRNPWDRFVSAYSFLRAGGITSNDAKASRKLNRFDDFTEFVLQLWKERGTRQWFMNRFHFRPQYEFLCDIWGRRLVTDVCRFEKLPEDINAVQERLGLNGTLPVHNKSDHKDYREYYNHDTRRIVGKLYARDQRIFHYQFEGSAE